MNTFINPATFRALLKLAEKKRVVLYSSLFTDFFFVFFVPTFVLFVSSF